MKKISLSRLPFVVALFIMMSISSCSRSRFYKDYSYAPKEQAPDISGETQVTAQEGDVKNISPAIVNSPEPAHSSNVLSISGSEQGANNEKMEQVVLAFKEEMAIQQEQNEKLSNRQMVKKVSQRLTDEGKISPLSKSQEKKLDRMAIKMDKKLKKADKGIDFKNNTPLELFFMIMGIAGLVLAIIVGSWAWFIFIVFGGLWLYFKLVEDNK